MIDLHCHILPQLDDGPVNLDFSLAMASAATAAGTDTLVATPHVRSDHRFEPGIIGAQVDLLNAAIGAAAIPLRVLAGAEIAAEKVGELDDVALNDLCLGSGGHALLESPYSTAGGASFDGAVSELQRRGFVPLLAHPERAPIFQQEPSRLEQLVHNGALCSITAGSLAGRFGRTPQRFALRLVRERLVHDIASDAHDHLHRPPALNDALTQAGAEAGSLSMQWAWLTEEAPRAILAGQALPPRPVAAASHPRRWHRLAARFG